MGQIAKSLEVARPARVRISLTPPNYFAKSLEVARPARVRISLTPPNY